MDASAAQQNVCMDRVPTDDNVSDLPSREEYDLLQGLGAVWRPPVVAQVFPS